MQMIVNNEMYKAQLHKQLLQSLICLYNEL